MSPHDARTTAPVIAVLGGTGHVGVPFISEFLAQGLQVKILARSPGRVAERFPAARKVVHAGGSVSPRPARMILT